MNSEDITLININDIEYGTGNSISKMQTVAKEVINGRVNWQAYLQCETINEDEYKFFQELEQSNSPDRINSLIHRNEEFTVSIFISLLNKISKNQTLQYILTLLDQILVEDKSRTKMFIGYFKKRNETIWPHFFKFFHINDDLCMYQASRIITKLACWSGSLMEENDLVYFYRWILEQLTLKEDHVFANSLVRCLQMMLRLTQYRDRFVSIDGISKLVHLLEKNSGYSQQCYQLIFCLWVLTFDAKLSISLAKNGSLTSQICDIFCQSDKEKIYRICLAYFRSIFGKLLEENSTTLLRNFSLSLVQCKVLKQLDLLNQKDFTHDKELVEDMEFISEKLSSSVQDVSSLEEYTTELKSGRLEWSPVHKSEKFWIENACNFTNKNYELLKMLMKLMEVSTDPTIISIALYDIGEFVRHYPRGKQVIEQLGAKTRVMTFLEHEDGNVRYNALVALQKIMVHKWEYLGRQIPGDKLEDGGQKPMRAI